MPQSVLFACTLNAVRSPMAEALARQLLPRHVFVASAGIAKRDVDGFAVAVMREIGLDIGDHLPQSLGEIGCCSFDVIVALSPEAESFARDAVRASATEVEFWPVPDLSGAGDTRNQRLDAFREVREMLRRRIRARFIGAA
ncbi:MAG TPA: hypothetical protein VGC10_03325 [Sphingomonas sp.]